MCEIVTDFVDPHLRTHISASTHVHAEKCVRTLTVCGSYVTLKRIYWGVQELKCDFIRYNGPNLKWIDHSLIIFVCTQIPIALFYLSHPQFPIYKSICRKTHIKAQKNRYCIAGHLEMHWSYKDSSRQLQLNFKLFIIELLPLTQRYFTGCSRLSQIWPKYFML